MSVLYKTSTIKTVIGKMNSVQINALKNILNGTETNLHRYSFVVQNAELPATISGGIQFAEIEIISGLKLKGVLFQDSVGGALVNNEYYFIALSETNCSIYRIINNVASSFDEKLTLLEIEETLKGGGGTDAYLESLKQALSVNESSPGSGLYDLAAGHNLEVDGNTTINSQLELGASGTGWAKGAYLDLCGNGFSSAGGNFIIHACDNSGNNIKLQGSPNGSLLWNNNDISGKVEDITSSFFSNMACTPGEYHAYKCGKVIYFMCDSCNNITNPSQMWLIPEQYRPAAKVQITAFNLSTLQPRLIQVFHEGQVVIYNRESGGGYWFSATYLIG